jgi:hypothetical protein
VITLSRRLGHANPQITMSVYATEIEESVDHTIRRARVNALFAGTGMAALLAATDDHGGTETVTATGATVLSLPTRDAS